jgi:hypothetical protein
MWGLGRRNEAIRSGGFFYFFAGANEVTRAAGSRFGNAWIHRTIFKILAGEFRGRLNINFPNRSLTLSF